MNLQRLLTTLFVAATAFAPSPHLQALTKDQVLAAACKGCHQPNAVAPLSDLSTLTKSILFNRLRDYRTGVLEGTLMNRIARGYTLKELQRIATELARTAEPSDNVSPGGE